MFKRLLAVLALCAVLTGQQMSSTGGSTSTGGSLSSAPFGTVHSINLNDTETFSDTALASKHSLVTAISDAIGASPAISVHKIIQILASDAVGASDALSIHRKILLAAAQGATVSPAVATDHIAIYRPTTFTDSGVNQDGSAVTCSNDPFAFDGNPATSTSCVAFYDDFNNHYERKTVVWYGFPASAGGFSSLVLNVKSSGSIDPNCTSPSNGMFYSLNGGSSWISIPLQQGNYGGRTDQISLALSQDLTQVRVETHAQCDASTSTHATVTETVAEIWIQAQ